jgi:uncharacterized protein (DUF488 family)
LQSFCDRIGIEYRGFTSLGIPGKSRKDLKSKRDYEVLFNKYRKSLVEREEELEILHEMAKNKRIALMCFEKNPDYCHRGVIAEELVKRGSEVDIN